MSKIFYRVTVGFIDESGAEDGSIASQRTFTRTDGRPHDPIEFVERLIKHPDVNTEILKEIKSGFELASELVIPDVEA